MIKFSSWYPWDDNRQFQKRNVDYSILEIQQVWKYKEGKFSIFVSIFWFEVI